MIQEIIEAHVIHPKGHEIQGKSTADMSLSASATMIQVIANHGKQPVTKGSGSKCNS